jgi:hypothetical protein
LFFALVLAAAAHAEPTRNLTVVITHTFAGKPLQLGAPYVSTAGEPITISRLAYLLSEPGVARSEDREWLTSHNWFAYGDVESGRTTHVLDKLPPGKYDTLQFRIGPDAETDAADPGTFPARHALNPTVNGLHWGWTGGFVYLALEGHIAARAAFRITSPAATIEWK